MMTTDTAPEKPWQRRWAAEQLGVRETAAGTEARTVFLRRLVESDFVPPQLWPQALAILEGRQTSGAGRRAAETTALRAEVERLRHEVEAFAQRFWNFSVDERRQRWEQLRSTCANVPALSAWLERLEHGLDIGPMKVDLDVPLVTDLLRSLRQMYVLRPADWAARRCELLADAGLDVVRWQAAVAAVLREFPETAALQPTLLRELATVASRQRQRARLKGALFRPGQLAGVASLPPPPSKNLRFPWWLLVFIAIVFDVIWGS